MRPLLTILLTMSLVVGAATTNWWIGAPQSFQVAALLTGASLLVAASTPGAAQPSLPRWISALILALSTFGVVSLLLRGPATTGWRDGHALAAWLMATATGLLATSCPNPSSRHPLRLATLIWAGGGVIVSLTVSYDQNSSGLFYVGISLALLTLVLIRTWFRCGPLATQTANTLILLLLALPLADHLLFPSTHQSQPPLLSDRPYSYAVATRDPGALVRWWRSYQAQENKLFIALLAKDSSGSPRLRPGASTTFFQSHISINQLGFRGADFSLAKDRAYRIVALGESTTFGLTLDPADRPWPELLEQLIRDRLQPDRPVQVINAGVPGNTVEDNLARWSRDILPLKPDLIISYHGANGFHLLSHGLRPNRGKAPPLYHLRPLRLLGDLEHAMQVHWFNRRHFPEPNSEPAFALPTESLYAEAYRQLIQLTRQTEARLALATYSMAVNAQSDSAVVAFYEQRFPALRWQIKANDLHSELVESLGQQYPETILVDTRPSLDGQHHHFIDFMHSNADGRRLLAETMFHGIQDALRYDLALSPLPSPTPPPP